MEGYIYTGLLAFLGMMAFLLLTSPTIRKEIINHFDLNSAHREKEIEIPVKFRCWKCRGVNVGVVKVASYKEDVGDKRIALNCEFCTSMSNGTEVATVNMIDIFAPTATK